MCAGGIEPTLRGMVATAAAVTAPDSLLVEEVTESLLVLDSQQNLDLAALNLQRGRDHGLPGQDLIIKYHYGSSGAKPVNKKLVSRNGPNYIKGAVLCVYHFIEQSSNCVTFKNALPYKNVVYIKYDLKETLLSGLTLKLFLCHFKSSCSF